LGDYSGEFEGRTMARLVSNIGTEQRRQTANARKAFLYREMAAAITMGATNLIAGFPKYVPRGHPPEWYLARAEKAEQVSKTAGDMASLLVDMEKRNRLEAMTPEDVWDDLVAGHTYPGMEYRHDGWVDFLAFLIHEKVEDLPYLVPKLSREQCEFCQGRIRAIMEDLLGAFR
jgi:hypothetical protein